MQEPRCGASANPIALTSFFVTVLLVLLPLWGCSSKPSPPKRFEASKAAQVAMEMYDEDGDGKLSAKELAKCPALELAMPRVDEDNNKSLSSDEIAQRIEAYQSQSDFIGTSVRVMLENHPVTGATVVFEPEPFMGKSFQSFKGETNDRGMALLGGEKKKTPGLPVGFYRVTITRAGGEETVHGCEIADDAPSAGRLVFSL